MQEMFIRLQTIYHSAVWILLIGLQDVRTIATITWEVFSKKSRGILTRIKENKIGHMHVIFSVAVGRHRKHAK